MTKRQKSDFVQLTYLYVYKPKALYRSYSRAAHDTPTLHLYRDVITVFDKGFIMIAFESKNKYIPTN